MDSGKETVDIDIVYLWVNGNDPAWIAKKKAFSGEAKQDPSRDGKARYVDNDELKYSLRSIELYAPWIHRIFIVTDNQVPEWLDVSNPKIRIVDHKEILPAEALPCFNSVLIEHHTHRIPGLSEHFLLSNDDMFLNKPVQPGDFFLSDGLPVMRFLYRRPMHKMVTWIREHVLGKKMSHFNRKIENAARLVEQRYGRYYSWKSHHNIDAYLKSDFVETFNEFADDIKEMRQSHVRQDTDIQRHLYFYAALARKRGHACFVGRNTSFHVYISRQDHYDKLRKYNPMFFCMNDSEYSSDSDRKRSKEYLMQRFPEKSQFEK